MLHKIFSIGKPKLTSKRNMPQKLTSVPAGPDRSPAALRIIHPGGLIEHYYMAIPAARIIEKYPSFILTRPDVFRRPWDAVVPPGDILIPGQKYFVVPRQTVKKLRRRIKKPTAISSGILFGSSEGNNSLSSCEFSEDADVKRSSSGILINQSNVNDTNKPRNRGVRFFGIDKKDDSSLESSEQSSVPVVVAGKSSNRRRGDGRKGRSRNIVHWQPSLTSIEENSAAVVDE